MSEQSDGRTEVDLALRAITALFPDELARALLPAATKAVNPHWVDTQFAALERRLDRLLAVQTEEESRWIHIEWMHRWRRDLPERMFDYHAMATIAARFDLDSKTENAEEGKNKVKQQTPRIESVVVLLSGKEAEWKPYYAYRTSPKGTPWSGVRFRIEPVYQRTIAELRARGVLWQLFAPLAKDATERKLKAVVKELSEQLPRQKFVELSTAMLIVADADGRNRGLRPSLVASLPPEILMESTFLKEIRDVAEAQGRAAGRAEGKAEGKAEGEATAILTVLAARGLSVPQEIREQILACRDLSTLEQWLKKAATAKSAKAVVAS